MRTFLCDSCSGTLYFENDTCLACGQKGGFRPTEMTMCTVAAAASTGGRPCRNWTQYGACTETERAKRRVIFSLLQLGLPLLGVGPKRTLRFRLLTDERVDTVTGYATRVQLH